MTRKKQTFRQRFKTVEARLSILSKPYPFVDEDPESHLLIGENEEVIQHISEYGSVDKVNEFALLINRMLEQYAVKAHIPAHICKSLIYSVRLTMERPVLTVNTKTGGDEVACFIGVYVQTISRNKAGDLALRLDPETRRILSIEHNLG